MSASGGRIRNSLVLPVLFAVAALATFVALGTWQVERKAWKENLIKSMDARMSGPPLDLPPPASWPGLDPARDEFRHVRFSATFVPVKPALVYGGASASHSGTPGYWVFALARLGSGGNVVVNRGFVPDALKENATAVPQRPHSVAALGVIRWPQSRGFFTPGDNPEHNVWFVRDPAAIAAGKGWADVAPFYVDLESPVPPSGFPSPGTPVLQLRNEHLQYAITWYGLAAVVSVMFGYWLVADRRARRPAASL